MRRLLQLGLLTGALGMLACSSTTSAPDAASGEVFRIPVTISTDEGDVVFMAEVADTPDERQKGLMFRERMGDDEGMLFLFPDSRQRSFWMKNTLIPLDMIFIQADRSVLGIVENAEPKTTTSRSVPGDSQFVLEINGGLARKMGIQNRQTVRFVAPLPTR